MIPARAFRAFVSYCHADAAFAARLQRRLEAYRLPKRLAGGEAKGRLGPIFRDREDLSAASDLSVAVREAITASSALVVVASPDAARSIWVDREIALFREHHPGAPILVALARGEPSEAMPAALLADGVEPLAADFRPEGDGKRLAFLKIVAGLAGLPLDALIQRDAQRQIRRVTAVTLGAGVLVLVMAILLVLALRARAEADRQRAGAEGLVEFMLTTLREELKGEGRPQVMAKVDARAMDYYNAQGDLAALPDTSLELRARILHAMGEDDVERGELDEALAKFTEAHRATAAILARHPKDPDAIFAHAQSEYWVGYAAWSKRDRETATHHWFGYLAQATRLAAVEPHQVRGLVEQAYAEGNLCDLNFVKKFDLTSAEEHCRKATDFMKAALAMAPSDPKIARDLANRYGWIANVQLARKRYADAVANRQAEIALLDRLLAADPRNLEYIKRRTWSDIGLATIWIATEEPARAAELLTARWPVFRANLTTDRGDQLWETGLRMLCFLSKAQRLAGQDHRSTDAEIDRFMQRYLRLFPERRAQIEELRREI